MIALRAIRGFATKPVSRRLAHNGTAAAFILIATELDRLAHLICRADADALWPRRRVELDVAFANVRAITLDDGPGVIDQRRNTDVPAHRAGHLCAARRGVRRAALIGRAVTSISASRSAQHARAAGGTIVDARRRLRPIGAGFGQLDRAVVVRAQTSAFHIAPRERARVAARTIVVVRANPSVHRATLYEISRRRDADVV